MRSKWFCSAATIVLGVAVGCAQQAKQPDSVTVGSTESQGDVTEHVGPMHHAPTTIPSTRPAWAHGQNVRPHPDANGPHPGEFMARGAWGPNHDQSWQDAEDGHRGHPGFAPQGDGHFGPAGRPANANPPPPATQKVVFLGVGVAPVGPALRALPRK